MKDPFIRRGIAAAIAVAALATGCTTTGMGGGELVTPGKPEMPVLFSWQSRDGGISGSLTATVGDTAYVGQFLQITSETTSDTLMPMWSGWYGPAWGAWNDPWIGNADLPTFTRSYSGRVVATLRSGERSMRCRFDLATPSRGMGGGGQGECQLTGGRRIDATIDRRG